MRIDLKEVKQKGLGDEKDIEVLADLFINRQRAGQVRKPPGSNVFWIRIDDNERARRLELKAELYYSTRPVIQTLSTAAYHAWLRHQLVKKEFTSPIIRPAWLTDCVCMYEGQSMRFRVWRLRKPICKLVEDEQGKALLLKFICRVMMHDPKPGDHLVGRHLPESISGRAYLYLVSHLASIFNPTKLVKPIRQQGRRQMPGVTHRPKM